MPFIPPMLATRLTDLMRLRDPRYVAEPKLDGQRAQVHVRAGRTVVCYFASYRSAGSMRQRGSRLTR
jgi:ATP-dependent DNA ligase